MAEWPRVDGASPDYFSTSHKTITNPISPIIHTSITG